MVLEKFPGALSKSLAALESIKAALQIVILRIVDCCCLWCTDCIGSSGHITLHRHADFAENLSIDVVSFCLLIRVTHHIELIVHHLLLHAHLFRLHCELLHHFLHFLHVHRAVH